MNLSKGEEFSGISRKDIDERERLHTLVQLQAQEIEALKAEISILSRKGGSDTLNLIRNFFLISLNFIFLGHILPPTQPPANQIQATN